MIDSFSGEYRFLSNFYGSEAKNDIALNLVRVMLSGVSYPSVENAYQAAKCISLEDRRAYISCTAGQSKRLGKTAVIRSDWDAVKYNYMKDFVEQKFLNNKVLAELLVSTYPHELVEGNTWGDTYWGVCKGVGQNNLGKILMDVRAEAMGGEKQMTMVQACFTGHRPISQGKKKLPWGYKLRTDMDLEERRSFDTFVRALDKAIQVTYDDGCRVYATGMALGVDMYAAWRVNEFKKTHPDVTLIAYIPCYNQFNKWKPADQTKWTRIITEWCDQWFFVTEDNYTYKCMDDRNKAMVEDSQYCIAVWDGSSGGTGNCVRDANAAGLRLHTYNPETEALRRHY